MFRKNFIIYVNSESRAIFKTFKTKKFPKLSKFQLVQTFFNLLNSNFRRDILNSPKNLNSFILLYTVQQIILQTLKKNPFHY